MTGNSAQGLLHASQKQRVIVNLKHFIRYPLAGLIGGVLTAAAGLLLVKTVAGDGLFRLSYNTVFWPRKPISPNEVVVVMMDDESHDKLNQNPLEPWDRKLHAKLIDRLTKHGAKGIIFDVIFDKPMTNNPAADQELERAIKASGRVCLTADLVRDAAGVSGVGARRIVPPIDPFMDGAAAVGTAEMFPDQDLIVRQIQTGEKDDPIPSVGWAMASWLGVKATTQGDAERFRTRWINYYGEPGQVPFENYYRVISDDPEIIRKPPEFYRDKVVYVGAHLVTVHAGQRKDEYRSPFAFWLARRPDKPQFMAGVEIWATCLLNLIRNDWLYRLPLRYEAALFAAFGLFFGFALTQMRQIAATITAVGTAILISAVSFFIFSHYLTWAPWLFAVGVQIPLALTFSVTYNSIKEYVQKRLMEQSLSMYVSPAQVKRISQNPDMLKPGAEKHQLSILFSDIAGFTSFSEGMDSDELAHLMNVYFETAVKGCLYPTQGTVVKFIGDAIFAIWNAPELQTNHQELACRGALLLRDSVSSFHFEKRPNLAIHTRIGLHSGEANVGNFGSSTRIDYTAIGENINLASRMEGLNKYLGTDVLITGEIQAPVKDKFVTRFCGQFQLKGFEKNVDVYELIGLEDQLEPTRAWREAFAAALAEFKKMNLDAADAGFRCVLEMHPKDGPSQFYLKHIAELRAHPSDEEWTGVVELKEK